MIPHKMPNFTCLKIFVSFSASGEFRIQIFHTRFRFSYHFLLLRNFGFIIFQTLFIFVPQIYADLRKIYVTREFDSNLFASH